MNRVALNAFFAASAALLVTGCAKMTALTEVNEDGSWTRTVKFTVVRSGDTPISGLEIEEIFELPAGAEWKITKEDAGDETIYTAVRSVAPGEDAFQDVVIKDKNKVIMVNEISVRQIAPGRLEYREVIRWRGKTPEEITEPDAEIIQAIKEALPEGVGADEDIRDVALSLQRGFWRVLFGPGDPIFGQMIMHPDLAERRFKQRIGVEMNSVLESKFGDNLTVAQRRDVAVKMISFANLDEVVDEEKSEAEKSGPGGASGLVALTFVVKLPGRIVETNGEVDKLTGEVFWGLYPEAAAVGEIVLRAVCEVGN
ncbi:MAG: hypothetical protein IH851_00830 [Armatimonadetes bacterium]|nr:hypothetical protein [Armatimonadota bacterium]